MDKFTIGDRVRVTFPHTYRGMTGAVQKMARVATGNGAVTPASKVAFDTPAPDRRQQAVIENSYLRLIEGGEQR